MDGDPHDAFTTYQQAVHSRVLLPTVDHDMEDAEEQRALLALLYNKMAVEHRTSKGGSHELFLHLDEQRQGLLTKEDFGAALDKLGVPLTPEQLDWVIQRLDLDHDGRVQYGEFTRALSTWRAAQGKSPAHATGLTWEFEVPDQSPHKAKQQVREMNQRMVLAQFRQSLSPRSQRADESSVPSIMSRLRATAFEKYGSLKAAFNHLDFNHDKRLTKDELAEATADLGMELTPGALDALFRRFTADGSAVAYWEFVRALQGDPESPSPASEASDPTMDATLTLPEPALPTASAMLPLDLEELDDPKDNRRDDEVLRDMADAIHERGLHAHSVMKHLVPEADGSLDDKGLQALAERLGVKVSDTRARRLVHRGDVQRAGRLTNCQFVRLLSEAADVENAGAMNV